MDPALTPLRSLATYLHDNEDIQSRAFDGIGLYSRNTKLPPPLDLLTAQITSHRIILHPPSPLPSSPAAHGVSIALADVRSTEFYAGFLKSSAKVTLHLSTSPRAAASGSAVEPVAQGWTCGVCGFPNRASPPGAVDRLVNCSMCGISQDRSSLASALSSKSSPGGIPHSRPLSAAGSHSPSSLTISSPSAPALPSGSYNQIPCPTCTFLNSPLLNSCEICTTPLPKPSKSAVVKSDPPAATSTPATTPANVDSLIRLSFRRGGEKEFYTILKRVLGSRAWSGGLARDAPIASAPTGTSTTIPSSGIDRILSTMSIQDSTRSDHLDSSLRDLESLMAKAGDMVKLASALSTRAPVSEDGTTMSPTAMLSGPAVTQDMLSSTSASEEAYLRELAKELVGLLTGKDGLMVDGVVRTRGKGEERRKGRGMVGLDEVWCLWNRARGVALIPPKTFRSTLAFLPNLTQPSISLRTFHASSHCVLHTSFYSASSFRARLLSSLTPSQFNALPFISTVELALAEDLSVGLMKEMVEELEADRGEIVRDSQGGAGGGETWFRNEMSGWTWTELNEFT